MIKRNQQGVTLIELLIVLAILSLVGTLIWSVFIQGKEYTNLAMTKNQIQQEANYILVRLTKIHQTLDDYEILNDTPAPGSFSVKDNNTGKTEVFEHNRLNLSIQIEDPNSRNQNNVEVTLTITDKNNAKNTLTLETLLYRIEGGAFDEKQDK